MNLVKIEQQLEKIINKMNATSHDFVITSSNCDETVYFDQPFQVKDTQVAFKLLTTYYSIPNIRPGKNIFRYRISPDTPYEEIVFETGAWEFSAISDYLRGCFEFINKKYEYTITNSIMPDTETDVLDIFFGPETDTSKNDGSKKKKRAETEKQKPEKRPLKFPTIKLTAQVSTMKSILEIPEGHSVDFLTPNTIGSLLGFDRKVYEAGRYISENIVDINPVNTIQVHCDIVDGARINGHPSKCIHTFEPRTAPGHKIISEPKNLVYYPVFEIDSINKFRIWLTDDQGNIIDNRGEKLTIVLSLKR